MHTEVKSVTLGRKTTCTASMCVSIASMFTSMNLMLTNAVFVLSSMGLMLISLVFVFEQHERVSKDIEAVVKAEPILQASRGRLLSRIAPDREHRICPASPSTVRDESLRF